MPDHDLSFLKITKLTLKNFAKDKPLDRAAIIGFYTIFSLPAVLIIVVRIAGIFFGRQAVRGEIVEQISSIVGRGSALEVQQILENASQSTASTFGTIIGIVTMIFSATTVFIALQDALNAMWEVKAKPKRDWLRLIINRVLSVAMVASLGFLLLLSITLELLLGILNHYLLERFSELAIFLVTIGNFVISILISTIIFATIFKVLPDVNLQWKNTWIGAAVTAVLFVTGKYLLSLYFQFNPLADTYGAASSLVLILVWVFYSSVIFLLGAEFTQVYARLSGNGIQPAEHAVKIKVKELEK